MIRSHSIFVGTALAVIVGCGSPAAGLGRIGGPAPADVHAVSQTVVYKLNDLEGKGRPVLLVHGWDGKASEMAFIGEGLKARGFAPYSVDLHPSDARVSDTTRAMARAIDDVLARTGSRNLALVTHSMGGLDARYYLGMMFGAHKVSGVVTIATPHHGTIWGDFAHGEARFDLKQGSDLLKLLASLGPSKVPFTSIFSWTDQTVVPPHSAILDGATNLEHWGLSHAGILKTPAVLEQVVTALN